jgi:predicted HAD superfamily Cof-like phosphohydrolase
MNQDKVKEFMKLAGQATPEKIETPEPSVRILRVKLLLEEVLELAAASGVEISTGMTVPQGSKLSLENFVFSPQQNVDIVEVADALCDIEYVNQGAAVAYGIKLQPVFDAVHDSNMKKFGPGGYRRDDGKWVKPADWQKPDIQKVLEEQGAKKEPSEEVARLQVEIVVKQ